MRAQLVAILASSITMTCSAQDTYAWGENVGWINFDGHPIAPDGSSLGNGRVRVMGKHSGLAGYAQLRGHAWGENIGWINFDDNEHFVVPRCAADFAGAPGVIDIDDVLAFLQAFAMGSLAADMDRNATLDIDDVIDFLNEFSVGDCI